MLFSLQQLDVRMRRLLPLLSGLLAVLIDVQPLPGSGPASPSVLTTLCFVYFWSLHRPDMLPVTATFLIGLIYDALTGLPLGVTCLTLLLVRQLVVKQQRFFLAQSFAVIWACFLLLAPVAALFRWLLISLWWGTLFPFEPIMVELLLTLALFPLTSWLLGYLLAAIPRPSLHAP